MKAIVEVVSGTQSGQRFVLRIGQRIRFGRTSQAEASFAGDDQMSTLHFQVSTDDKACYLQDLNSTNGTLVNGESVKSVILRNGDSIQCGRTEFRVLVEGDRPGEVQPLPAPIAEESAAGSEAAARQDIIRSPYTLETCPSGLSLCRGLLEHAAPESLIDHLGKQVHPYLLLNPSGLADATFIEQLTAPDYIYDWLNAEAAAQASPVLIDAAEFTEWRDVLSAGWGNDALTCLFSTGDKSAVLSHLRTISGGQSAGVGRASGAVGIGWPSVLSALLSGSEAAYAQRLLNGLDGVLLESQRESDEWEFFGNAELPERLNHLGMIACPSLDFATSGGTISS